jgi:predicted nucleic acid-binding protein
VRYLLDTCIFSELSKPVPDSRVSEFLILTRDEDLWMSVLSIGELVKGVEALPQGKRRTQLGQWVLGTQHDFEGRLAAVDVETSRIWGELTGRLRTRGVQLAIIDGLIAATAIQHGMHVVTRNVKDFEPTGVLIVNPWEADV